MSLSILTNIRPAGTRYPQAGLAAPKGPSFATRMTVLWVAKHRPLGTPSQKASGGLPEMRRAGF
jgi:hypothetical protein